MTIITPTDHTIGKDRHKGTFKDKISASGPLYTWYSTFSKANGLSRSYGTYDATMTRATARSEIHEAANAVAPYAALVSSGDPAFNRWNPAADAREGISIEPTRINYLLGSRDPLNAAWIQVGTPTVWHNTPTGIFGVDWSAGLMNLGVGEGIEQTTSLVSTSKRVIFSVWLMSFDAPYDSTDVALQIEDSDAGAEQVSGLLDAETLAAGTITTTGWKKFYVTADFTAGVSGFVKVRLVALTDGLVLGFDVAGLEENISRGGYYDLANYPSSSIVTTTTTVQKNADFLSLDNREISGKFSWLYMLRMPFGYTDTLAANCFINLFSVSSDLGELRYRLMYAGGRLRAYMYYFGTNASFNSTSTPSWTAGQWVCVGGAIDTDADIYDMIWDGTYLGQQTTAKGTPTYNSVIGIGSQYNNANQIQGDIAHMRIYNNLYLSQAEVTAQKAEIETLMGL